jgi:RNA polymerase sigma-70 factor (ECF subfamily)
MRISTEPETDLVRRAADGDADAFGELAVRHAESARRVARALLGNADDADDAVQDGVLAAWRSFDRFDPARPFGPWLIRIVLNAARDRGRRRKVREAEPLSPALAAGRSLPDQDAARSLLREALDRALRALPERHRLAITLFDAEGYAHDEIARILGVPVGTVRSDVFHARRALRAALGPYREDET